MRIATAPHQGVECRLSAREVHVGYQRRRSRSPRDLRVARDDLQEPCLDERRQRPPQHRLEWGMQRMQLEEARAAVFKDLADAVGGGEAGDIASPQDDGHAAGSGPRLGLELPDACEGVDSARIHAPHRGTVSAEDHGIEQAGRRHHVHLDPCRICDARS